MAPFKCDTPEGWRRQLAALPAKKPGERLPTFFYAHGHPGIYFRSDRKIGGQDPDGSLNAFLKDFGPALLEKYQPKAIVVFSAHWDTRNEILVSDWGDNQPLYLDYYNFPSEWYDVHWRSNGSHQLSEEIVQLLKSNGVKARLTGLSEPRQGRDGKGQKSTGLDHGVFIPNLIMFPQKSTEEVFPIPMIQVSFHTSFSSQDEFALGKAVAALRDQGALIIAGGLTIHTFRDWSAWEYDTASEEVKDFEREIVKAASIQDGKKRLEALAELAKHPGFRLAHPKEDHFVPLWVAAGAASDENDKSLVVADIHGAKTVAFGI